MAKVDAPRNRAFSIPLEVTRATTRITKNTTELRKIGGRWCRGGDVGGGGNRLYSFFTLRSPGTYLWLTKQEPDPYGYHGYNAHVLAVIWKMHQANKRLVV